MKFYLTCVNPDTNLPVATVTLYTDVVDANGDVLTTEAVLKMMDNLDNPPIKILHAPVEERNTRRS